MVTEQETESKETKKTEKCTCTKRIITLEKEVAKLKAEIELLRRVLRGVR